MLDFSKKRCASSRRTHVKIKARPPIKDVYVSMQPSPDVVYDAVLCEYDGRPQDSNHPDFVIIELENGKPLVLRMGEYDIVEVLGETLKMKKQNQARRYSHDNHSAGI